MANILGVKISEIKRAELLLKLEDYLLSKRSHYLTTPNPEIILKAYKKDEEYFHILNNADISIADGIGLKLAAYLSLKNIPRITGADLLFDILELLNGKNKKLLVLNWEKGLSTSGEIQAEIQKNYKQIELKVMNCDQRGENLNLEEVNNFSADFMLVNFGAPYQERFIFHNYRKLNNLKCAIGVGGAFDFLTAKIKRAPKIIRSLGMEWLWRLLKQPKRIKRILNATVVFFYKFLLWRFIYPHLYRPNVACFVYKKESGKFKILIVKRATSQNHWQLPQGGTDGESLKKAGMRELQEELNTDKFRYLTIYKNLHKYKFDDALDSSGVSSREANGYQGQKQGLCIAEFIGEDSDICLNYYDHSEWKWVSIDNLISEVHECRKIPTSIFIKKFNEIKNKL